MPDDLLVIVPCGQAKIWDKKAEAGATPAKDAYIGPPFVINRQFAECFGDAWVILSAKYGFIEPTFEIAGKYNVTFKKKATGPISIDRLQKQIQDQKLERFKHVIGLGGKEYRKAIAAVFRGTSAELHFPYAGLTIGKAMRAAKKAIENKECTLSRVYCRTMTIPSSSEFADVAKMCHTIHVWFNARPMFSFPFREEDIPLNGIYILFEEGEHAHGTRRIVRVGTHTGHNQLRSRLKQHFLNANKDRSIFRKNVGRCLLNWDNDPFLETWDLDLTSRKAKERYANTVDFEKQKEIERRVSDYIQRNLQFVVFDVPEKEARLELEARIASTVSRCPECSPSKEWLGLSSPKKKIRESGLWQVNELYKRPFSEDEWHVFKDHFQPDR